jgi:hypothetical protein
MAKELELIKIINSILDDIRDFDLSDPVTIDELNNKADVFKNIVNS